MHAYNPVLWNFVAAAAAAAADDDDDDDVVCDVVDVVVPAQRSRVCQR